VNFPPKKEILVDFTLAKKFQNFSNFLDENKTMIPLHMQIGFNSPAFHNALDEEPQT
jgi:hypothetical protein